MSPDRKIVDTLHVTCVIAGIGLMVLAFALLQVDYDVAALFPIGLALGTITGFLAERKGYRPLIWFFAGGVGLVLVWFFAGNGLGLLSITLLPNTKSYCDSEASRSQAVERGNRVGKILIMGFGVFLARRYAGW